MMSKLLQRGEELGRAAQKRRIDSTAAHLRELLSGNRVDAEETRILVSGRSLLGRWLVDPGLRFLAGDGR
jgi:hypothetical protein